MHNRLVKSLATLGLFLAMSLVVSLASCASGPRPEKSFAQMSVPGEKKQGAKTNVNFYRNGDGLLSFRMTGGIRGAPTLVGSATPADDGSYDLRVSGLEWFSNWEDGWTEATFCVTGALRLSPEGDDWVLSRQGDWRIEYPETARIRYRDNVIDGETSTKLLSNRWDRIQAISAYLAEKGYQWPFLKEASRELLPEIYGYPADYSGAKPGASSKAGKARLSRAEGVSWNMDYTESRYPESLRDVRNSGTAYRDWIEARDLFVLALEWDRIYINGLKVKEIK